MNTPTCDIATAYQRLVKLHRKGPLRWSHEDCEEVASLVAGLRRAGLIELLATRGRR